MNILFHQFGFLVLTFAACSIAYGQSNIEAANSKQASDSKSLEKTDKTDELYWIFLTTGKSTDGVEPEAIETMQSKHLANFKRLAKEGKLLTAGPMNDPEKKLRGIVVVKAADQAALATMFKEDPYVQGGYLKIEATQMEFNHGAIKTNITPQGLDEFRLVVLEKSETSQSVKGDQDSDRNLQFISAMSADKDLLLTVFLPRAEYNRTALLIMAISDEDVITKKVQDIPAVKSGDWKSRVFPLYMGKGTFSAS